MQKQFWVIGGEYRDTSFVDLIDGTSRVFGPFRDYNEARAQWGEQSMARRSEATTRFTIVSNAAAAERLPQPA